MKPNHDTFAELLNQGLEIQNAIASTQASRSERIESGDLFLLKMPIPASVTWCAAFSHSKDSDLWYCVPGDSFSLLANCDVASDETEHTMPLNFRCRCGLWIHSEDIDVSNRISQLTEDIVVALRDKVAALADDPIALLSGDEIGSDPDYENWIDELRIAVDSLRESLHDEPTISVRLVDRKSELALTQLELALAAADNDPEIELPTLIRTLQVFKSIDGLLKACLYDDGLVLEWHPSDEESSKPTIASHGTELAWTPQDGSFCTGLIVWVNGAVVVTVNHELVQIAKD
ncbi:hypothetical protein CA51_13580 [Rosistilla oblonga]|uniref:hypothetical protein n=1 Tax=Rosistilla oblonga TaxID=2527990 RepID=UPI00118B59F9|nr:hypothetical protein [Rosistilla oblonga]QDV11494.1 hypothetical protein CA51_13580 [Rosistilla oblonga]